VPAFRLAFPDLSVPGERKTLWEIVPLGGISGAGGQEMSFGTAFKIGLGFWLASALLSFAFKVGLVLIQIPWLRVFGLGG